MRTVGRYRRLIAQKDYAALSKHLVKCDLDRLAVLWDGFPPLEKLVLFKLCSAKRALMFYEHLDFEKKYFLLCGFDRNSIAPVLEGLSRKERALFKTLPVSYYDRMLHQVACEKIEIQLPVRIN